jgi:hypothetical protein
MQTFLFRGMMKIAAIVMLAMIFSAAAEKPRVVVLSDISNEPDDQMSFVRLLTYADVIDLEGLIAVTGCWKTKDPDIAALRKLIAAYGKVYDTLKLHSPDYPTADYLSSIVKTGVNGYGMSAAAQQLDNEGVDHIVKVLEKNDPRPVWFTIWGGANTLGGAVMKIKNEKGAAAEGLLAKIRTYDIALQDDGSAYISHQFPQTILMTSRVAWRGISHSRPGWSDSPESWGGNNDVFNSEWCSANVQQGHGALGEMYPDVMWRWEGDSPSFLYLVPNGLNFPDHKTYGGWGGRFGEDQKLNILSGTQNDSVDPLLAKQKDYRLYMETGDTWTYKGTTYTDNEYCAIFRWREDFQNDFAARMDRCVKPYGGVNHAPRPIVDGDTTLDPITRTAPAGTDVSLDASKSIDPDGNALNYSWFIYKEPGTYSGGVSIADAAAAKVKITVPSDALGKNIHVILGVKDNGSPALVGYRRIVIAASIPSNVSFLPQSGEASSPAVVIRRETDGKLRVSIKSMEECNVRVSALNGRLLARQCIHGKEPAVFTAGSAGVYLITIDKGAARMNRIVAMQ